MQSMQCPAKAIYLELKRGQEESAGIQLAGIALTYVKGYNVPS